MPATWREQLTRFQVQVGRIERACLFEPRDIPRTAPTLKRDQAVAGQLQWQVNRTQQLTRFALLLNEEVFVPDSGDEPNPTG
jgi:hypothetical protein